MPVISKTGGTVDRVNRELDKIDPATDSAVDAVVAVDEAVRAVSFAVKRPIEKLVGASAGARHGFATHARQAQPEGRGCEREGGRGTPRGRLRRGPPQGPRLSDLDLKPGRPTLSRCARLRSCAKDSCASTRSAGTCACPRTR